MSELKNVLDSERLGRYNFNQQWPLRVFDDVPVTSKSLTATQPAVIAVVAIYERKGNYHDTSFRIYTY